MNKQNKLFLIKLIPFLIILFIIINELTTVLAIKTYPLSTVHPNANSLYSDYVIREKQDGFYSLPNDCLDVVFIGSSAVHCNINPGVIWNDYGITGYDFACDMQELGISYYYLKEMFKTQSPKVVMIDINSDGTEYPLTGTAMHYGIDPLKPSFNKLCAIFDRARDKWTEMLFPIITYHERWKALQKSEFLYKSQPDVFKGAFIYTSSVVNEAPVIPDQIPYSELSDVTVEWFEKILKLCEENDCDVVLMRTPFVTYSDEQFSYLNAVSRYCDDKGKQFFNFTTLADEIGIDFSNDFVDTLHMNWNGQKKMSDYVGNYLFANYDFTDKRNDKAYESWTKDYEEMLGYIEECQNMDAGVFMD